MQPKKHSAFEAIINSVVGFFVSTIVTYFVLAANVSPTAVNVFAVSVAYFLVSTIRGYLIRRAFNAAGRVVD